MVHPGRCQPQRRGRRFVQEAGRNRLARRAAAAAAAGRAHLRGIARGRHRAQHVRRQRARSRARHRLRRPARDDRPGRRRRRRIADARRHRAHARRADAVSRRAHLSRLSAWLQGREDRTGVRRADVRLQRMVRRHRLGDVRPSARAAGRHDPGPCRRLQIQPLRVHQQRVGQSHGAARRHLLPDG